MDHSGELPLLLAFESMRRYNAKEPALRVLCGPEVEHKLKTHRLDELLSTSYTPVSYFFDAVEYIDWCECLVSCRIESLVQASGVFYQGLDFGLRGNLGVRRKIISWSVKSRELRNATHRWRRVRNRTKATLMESVLSPRCIFVPLTKQGKATLNDKHHPDKLIQLITFERGLGQLFEKT